MLVYICESWVSLNHRSYCTVAEVNKGILSDCRGSLGGHEEEVHWPMGMWHLWAACEVHWEVSGTMCL